LASPSSDRSAYAEGPEARASLVSEPSGEDSEAEAEAGDGEEPQAEGRASRSARGAVRRNFIGISGVATSFGRVPFRA
jgi:hypothetical protein